MSDKSADAATRLEANLHLMPVFYAEDIRAVLAAADDAIEAARVVIRVIPDEYIPVRFMDGWRRSFAEWALARGTRNTAPDGCEGRVHCGNVFHCSAGRS